LLTTSPVTKRVLELHLEQPLDVDLLLTVEARDDLEFGLRIRRLTH
jgi:hypothetical protein